MDCPKCLGKLNKVEIKFHEIADMPTQKGVQVSTLEVDQCFVCNGIWFDIGELEKYLEKKLTILDSPAIAVDLIIKQDEKISNCPRCNTKMTKKAAPIAKDITMDWCENCRGVWLDSTEIDRIENRNISLKQKIGLFIKSLLPKK
ncbi:MAG: zf-TFIIB domain-containing protein [Candidatus Omnitrophota bacterium]